MSLLCKHCATSYTESSGVDGFCCSGCRQVYQLIQDEGLEDFYRKQDRAAQPLKDRSLADVDSSDLRSAQIEVEQQSDVGEAVFNVEGMSCMGCAWLIDRICRKQAGVVKAEASLSTNSLRLQWRSEAFDLVALSSELLKFGYRLDSRPRSDEEVARLSPLALRLLLTAVFTGNALILAAYQEFVDHNEVNDNLVSLLSLACLCFTLLIGGAPFLTSVYRAMQIRRVHSDWFAVALIIFFGFYVSSAGLSAGAFGVSLLVLILIFARWFSSIIR